MAMTFNEYCERLTLVAMIDLALDATAYLEGERNLGPEEDRIQRWRERAKETLALELRRRPTQPIYQPVK